MRKDLLPRDRQFYKANLHCHSTVSDGKFTPEELKKQYMDLRFQMVIGHVDNPLQKRTMRREIARINTLIRQKEIAGQDK